MLPDLRADFERYLELDRSRPACSYIGPGAKLFGSITIGDNARIGANAVVNRDVAEGTLVGGVPAEVIREPS